MACGNPYELGGQITQPELSRGDAPVFLVNQILEAQRRNGEWVFLTQWAGYESPTIQPESDFEGCDSVVRGMLDMAEVRYLGAVEEAAKRSGARRSCVKTSASAIQDLSTHVVEKDRPSRRRPPTRRVIAAISTQERHARRVQAEYDGFIDENSVGLCDQ
eukprot:2304647-Pleurochrysis_carterae.AAC.1